MKKITKSEIYKAVREDYTILYNPMPEEWKKLFPVITIDICENFGFHFTDKHTGKMVGFTSLSTTCKCNENCQNRIYKSFGKVNIDMSDIKEARKALKDYLEENPYTTSVCICAFCFSDAQQDYQKSMQMPLRRNFEILNNGIIHPDWLPTINTLFFRGESFGDFASINAVINFYNIARKNPLVSFTAWTKNLIFFDRAFQSGHDKPQNFKLVYSSFFINKQVSVPDKYRYLVNAVFTVYTQEFADKYNITINCGARACLSCLRCYTGYTDEIKVINELLK